MTNISVKTHNQKIANILIILSLIFLVFFIFQWFSIQNALTEIKDTHLNQYQNLLKVKTNLIDIDKLEKNKEVYILDINHLKEINKNIDNLANEIFNERNRAETIIDKDIDRLNLYMAIGIGFIAIIGIFIPLLINYLSFDELKEKQNRLKESFNQLKDKTESLPSSEELKNTIDNSNILLSKSSQIDALKISADLIFPKVTAIGLQIAINRLFTVNSVAIKNYSRGNKELYIGLYTHVLSEMKKCKEDELHTIGSHEPLKQTLTDFSIMLNEERFRFSSILNEKKIDVILNTLSQKIEILARSNKNDEAINYDSCILEIEKIISFLKSK